MVAVMGKAAEDGIGGFGCGGGGGGRGGVGGGHDDAYGLMAVTTMAIIDI
jgi:hypothetical protein